MDPVTETLFGTVTVDMLHGVLDGITELFPIVLPVMIGYIAFRKGVAFIKEALYSA